MSSSVDAPQQNTPPAPTSPNQAAGLARAASLIAAGNVTSRLLGLGRETVIAALFGATGSVSAFRVAQIIPPMLYDLLVGGMVSSALVPVFSTQAENLRLLETNSIFPDHSFFLSAG